MRVLSGVKSLNLTLLVATSLLSKILSIKALGAGSIARGAFPVVADLRHRFECGNGVF
jgi:hypothetical protein